MPNSSKKVLILALSGIGNYIMQSPATRALKEAHPEWYITAWVAPRGTKELAENDPNVDEVIEAPIKNGLTGHLRQTLRLSRAKYDVGIVLSPGQLVKSASYLFLAGIPRRIGNTYPFRGNPESRFLLTDPVPPLPDIHDVEQNLHLLTPLAVAGKRVSYTLDIPVKAERNAQEIIRQLQLPNTKTLIGFHAGSSLELAWKRWPLENFAAVAKNFIEKHNAHVLIFGGSEEEEQKQELARLIESQLPTTNYQLQTVSIISASLIITAAIMKQCKLFISNDSGLMHLSAASGVKTFGIFGPTDETRTGPRGIDSHVIRAPGTTPAYDVNTAFYFDQTVHPSLTALSPQYVIDKIYLMM